MEEESLCCLLESLCFSRAMYLICSKCHRVLRSGSVEKHAKKCQDATFNCCDCNGEFDVETLSTHTACPNAIKTMAPAVFNPKAVRMGAVV